MTRGNPSYWSEIIQKWQSSGCNMTEFCRQENISVHTFKYWKYKVSRQQELRNSFVGFIKNIRTGKACSG